MLSYKEEIKKNILSYIKEIDRDFVSILIDCLIFDIELSSKLEKMEGKNGDKNKQRINEFSVESKKVG